MLSPFVRVLFIYSSFSLYLFTPIILSFFLSFFTCECLYPWCVTFLFIYLFIYLLFFFSLLLFLFICLLQLFFVSFFRSFFLSFLTQCQTKEKIIVKDEIIESLLPYLFRTKNGLFKYFVIFSPLRRYERVPKIYVLEYDYLDAYE